MNNYIAMCYVWSVLYRAGESLVEHGVPIETAQDIYIRIYRKYTGTIVEKSHLKFGKKSSKPTVKKEVEAKPDIKAMFNTIVHPEWIALDEDNNIWFCKHISLSGGRHPVFKDNVLVYAYDPVTGACDELSDVDQVLMKGKGYSF